MKLIDIYLSDPQSFITQNHGKLESGGKSVEAETYICCFSILIRLKSTHKVVVLVVEADVTHFRQDGLQI